jgi:hypothetical protein
MFSTHPFARSSFWLKVGVAVVLAVLADHLFFHAFPWGATLGGFAAAWIVGLGLVRPGLLRDRRALFALIGAGALAGLMVERPGLLSWALFALLMTVAALSARVATGEPAWRWAQRLFIHGVVSLVGPILDAVRLARLPRRRPSGVSPVALLKVAALPVVGGLIFLLLFARANPVIADFLDVARIPAPSGTTVLRLIGCLIVMLMVATTLRPRWYRGLMALPSLGERALPGVSTASVTLSLIVFNALFALQNGLDVAFLWSGAPLPGEMTLADYAHRGAYPLIATALLAGLFVLVALRPGSETARRPLVRGLVVGWVAQNMVLVASSMLRTADYIEGYALTRFRIVAMVWMVMVGIGLLLICWRLLRDKDGHWLIDANVKLVLVVLAGISTVDLGAVAASWNVRHAREIDGTGAQLDVGYLRALGYPAVVSMVRLEQTTTDPALRDRVAAVRGDLLEQMRRDQSNWRSWTYRNARRLDRIDALTAHRPLIPAKPGEREWDGRLRPPPPPPEPPVPVPPLPVSSTGAPVPSATLVVTPLTSAPGV